MPGDDPPRGNPQGSRASGAHRIDPPPATPIASGGARSRGLAESLADDIGTFWECPHQCRSERLFGVSRAMCQGQVIHRPTVMHMPDMNHVYVTAHGSYPAGPWLGESAQIGVRLAFSPTVGAPSKGDIWTPTPGGTINADFGTQSGTNGILQRTWKARVGPVGSTENMDAGAQVDMAEDMRKFLNAVKSYQSSNFRWTHIKLSAVTADGKTPIVSSIYNLTTPIAGSGATPMPPQVAMALSTRANLVGRRGRGRIYLPALDVALLAADGTVVSGSATLLRTAFKTLIDDLQAQPGLTQHLPLVFVGSADSPTVVRPVEVRTGNRFDTIQSRRRQVAEAYTATAL